MNQNIVKIKKIKQSINESTFSFCDGRPIYLMMKRKSKKPIDHITGRVLMHKICQRAENENLSIGIYGGTIANQKKCIDNLLIKYPKLKIDFAYSPDQL